jgi:hypothetical protein
MGGRSMPPSDALGVVAKLVSSFGNFASTVALLTLLRVVIRHGLLDLLVLVPHPVLLVLGLSVSRRTCDASIPLI